MEVKSGLNYINANLFTPHHNLPPAWGRSFIDDAMTIAVEFTHVSRHYGNIKAVDDVTISVAEGEFFSMLGPSGSGKNYLFTLDCGL